MTTSDFALLAAEYRLSPWGEDRADLRAAIGHALLANAHRDPKAKPDGFVPADFMPFRNAEEAVRVVELPPEAFVSALIGMGNVVDRRGKRRKRKRG